MRTAERYPETATLGIDLTWLSPCRVVPENCSFDIANAEDPWEFLEGQKLDFAFIRFLGWFTPWETLFAHAYDNLQPGGWIESHEWVIDIQSQNRRLKGSALEKWCKLLQEGKQAGPQARPHIFRASQTPCPRGPARVITTCDAHNSILSGLQKMGKSLYHAYSFRPMLERSGFTKIDQRQFGVPLSPWCKDKRYRRLGAMMLQNQMKAVTPVTYAVLCNGLKWTTKDADELIEKVILDFKNTKLQAFTTM